MKIALLLLSTLLLVTSSVDADTRVSIGGDLAQPAIITAGELSKQLSFKDLSERSQLMTVVEVRTKSCRSTLPLTVAFKAAAMRRWNARIYVAKQNNPGIGYAISTIHHLAFTPRGELRGRGLLSFRNKRVHGRFNLKSLRLGANGSLIKSIRSVNSCIS